MTKKKKAKWICARCARRKEVEPETDPVVLRVCDWCNIENWTRPVGHGGANAGGGPVMEVKVDKDGERLPLYKKGEVAPSVTAVEEPVIEAETVVEEVIEEAVEEAVEEEVAETNQTMTAKEKQILDLKAQLEELEK